MKKIVLLIDMDGVVAEWYPGLLATYIERFPDREYIAPDEVSRFYVEELYPEEHRQDVMRISREKGFYRNLPVMPGAKESLADIQNNCLDFIDPFICTAPELESDELCCHTEKVQYVQEHFGDFWARRTILTKDKTLVYGNYLIDDKPVINGLLQPTWEQIHYAQPYNKYVRDVEFTWAQWNDLKMDLYVESGSKRILK